MIEALSQPFAYSYMVNAMWVSALVGRVCGFLSCFPVLKGWALMGDAISHAILPGIVIAHVIGAPLILGAFCAGMISALATGYLTQNSRVKADTVMGVEFSGMFGLGIVLFVASGSALHLDHILFGNLLGVSGPDLWQTGIIAALVAGLLILKWKDWLLHSFDPAQARASGLWVGALHYGLLAMITLTIIATLTAAGLGLAVSLLIAPGGHRLSAGPPVFHHVVGSGRDQHDGNGCGGLPEVLHRQRARPDDCPGAERAFHPGFHPPPGPDPPRGAMRLARPRRWGYSGAILPRHQRALR